MTSRDFCYWLQGFFELTKSGPIDQIQAKTIEQHLALVFAHEIDPSFGDKAKQEALNEIHTPPKPLKPFPPMSNDVKIRC